MKEVAKAGGKREKDEKRRAILKYSRKHQWG